MYPNKTGIIVAFVCVCMAILAGTIFSNTALALPSNENNTSLNSLENLSFVITNEQQSINNTEPITKIVYTGEPKIKSAIIGKSENEKQKYIVSETNILLNKTQYPYTIKNSNIKILNYSCKETSCAYWISAKNADINNPIRLYNPPYHVLTSETYDSVNNENIQTIQEKPDEAVYQILTEHVDRHTTRQS